MPDPAMRDLLDLLGDRWVASILAALDTEDLRYFELERRIPAASRRMISRTLRSLERDGLIERTVQHRPIQVTYALSDLGRSLQGQLRPLNRWAQRHHADILAARAADRAEHAAAESKAS